MGVISGRALREGPLAGLRRWAHEERLVDRGAPRVPVGEPRDAPVAADVLEHARDAGLERGRVTIDDPDHVLHGQMVGRRRAAP